MIAIFHNGQAVDKTQRTALNTFETCFNSFNVHNDIFRIASEGQETVSDITKTDFISLKNTKRLKYL